MKKRPVVDMLPSLIANMALSIYSIEEDAVGRASALQIEGLPIYSIHPERYSMEPLMMPESKPHKPFDTATKRLIDTDPLAWLHLAGLPGSRVLPENTNLTTLTADADRFFRVEEDGKDPYLANVELQSGDETHGDDRMLLYAAIAYYKLKIPVQSVVFLLRPEADGSGFSGSAGFVTPTGSRLLFTYRLVRVWEIPVEEILSGSVALLPLAPIANVTEADLPAILRRIASRIDSETDSGERALLWTATGLLMGLRYPLPMINTLLKGVREMKESVFYQAILQEGKDEGKAEGKSEQTQSLLLRIGGKRFGPPDAEVETRIAAISSLEELERLADRLLEVESWAELLQ